MRSGLRSRCAAPVRLSTSNSIRRCAANPTISRSKSASELFSSSVRRLIISSVIVGSLVLVERFGDQTLPKIRDDHGDDEPKAADRHRLAALGEPDQDRGHPADANMDAYEIGR